MGCINFTRGGRGSMTIYSEKIEIICLNDEGYFEYGINTEIHTDG
jgi:hypothetical protein